MLSETEYKCVFYSRITCPFIVIRLLHSKHLTVVLNCCPLRLTSQIKYYLTPSYCYIARYTDVWKRHRESEIHDIHEIGSGTKLYNLWVKDFSTRGERNTIFLCWLVLNLPPTTCVTPSANYWSGLGGTQKSTFQFGCTNSTNCFSEILKIISASGHDVIHLPPVRFPICEFLF